MPEPRPAIVRRHGDRELAGRRVIADHKEGAADDIDPVGSRHRSDHPDAALRKGCQALPQAVQVGFPDNVHEAHVEDLRAQPLEGLQKFTLVGSADSPEVHHTPVAQSDVDVREASVHSIPLVSCSVGPESGVSQHQHRKGKRVARCATDYTLTLPGVSAGGLAIDRVKPKWPDRM
ncbi:hypothetical protein ACCAA_310104 [Candidatus Accumulibacter aalborgensis]|uniref:Uncharacterized protein n=1 Tax=Candidatus Accumulibacter aalborgensis TaxID=1860102 RepID=A0A1A8XPL2_9PROT|nr:hypothetical protein ACCAA_310104 [Candidatus Accumulibacter aalborgensis]